MLRRATNPLLALKKPEPVDYEEVEVLDIDLMYPTGCVTLRIDAAAGDVLKETTALITVKKGAEVGRYRLAPTYWTARRTVTVRKLKAKFTPSALDVDGPLD